MIQIRPTRQTLKCATALWLALCAGASVADDVLVVLCQPRTVRGEPAGLHVRLYTVDPGPSREVRLELPQARLAQPMQPMFGGRLVALLTQGVEAGLVAATSPGDRELVLFRTAPLERVITPWTPGWQPTAILAEPLPIDEECRLVLLERRIDAQGPPRGRVRVVGVRLRESGAQFALRGQWDLHAAPVAGDIHWEDGWLYAACEGPRTDTAAIVAINLLTGEQRYAPVQPARDAVLGSAPAALAVVRGGSRLAFLESAYSLERRDGGRISALRLLDTATLEDTGAPMNIAGAAADGEALFTAHDGEIIVGTVDEATGFAYATAIAAANMNVSKQAEWGFRDVTAGPRVVASPDTARVAIAGGRSLLVLGAGPDSQTTHETTDAIEAMVWNDDALYVADGPRLHRLSKGSDMLSAELARFGGFVVDLLAIPAPEGPLLASHPALAQVPPRVSLTADTPGRDRRVIPLTLPPGVSARLTHDERAAPWLSAVLEVDATGSTRIALSLNRQRLLQPGEHRSRVQVQLFLDLSGKPIVVGETLIEISAASYAKGTRAVEWQSPAGFEPLMHLISGPPLHLSQRTRRGPIAQAPRGTAAVVVRLDDVARGAITRQVLLDYVSAGGGLLVIARHAPEIAGESLRRWLEPLGLLIDPAQAVSGAFAIPSSPAAAFGLDQLGIAAGAYIETTRPMEFAVPGPAPGSAALALTQHGYGRLAVIADGAPLEEAALGRPANRRFARALFGWLAGANRDVRDSDNDGLRDEVEDANANARKDAHETDYLNPDTDGDGVPDGLEDANLNGVVDEGETDPRRADSDGDGLPDGADTDPLPRSGTPAILAVRPQGGPAEGGTLVELSGRNLPVNPQVWFGERRASVVFRTDSTRVVAAVPPRIFGELKGPVSVRVADPLDLNEYVFKEAFTYRPPSAVELVLAPAARVRRAYDGYRGLFSLSLDVPEVRIDAAAFYLRTDPALSGLEAVATPSPALAQAGRALQLTKYGDSEFRVVIGPGEPLTGRTALGTVSWRLPDLAPPVNSIRWYVLYPDVRVLWGSNVDVLSNDIEVRLDSLDAKSVPARPPDPAAML